MVPQSKASPYGLLQEILWPDRWKCTVACILLNRTKRGQVDKVWPKLFEIAPGPEELLKVPDVELVEMLRTLGFYNVRVRNLKAMSKAFVEGAERLPGTGKYANDSDELFFGKTIPEGITDGVLVKYAEWRSQQPWKNFENELARISVNSATV